MGKRIKIAIDASKLTAEKPTGLENSVNQMIMNLVSVDHDNDYLLYTQKDVNLKLPQNAQLKIVRGRPWHNFILPLALLRDKPDIFLELSNGLPSISPKNSIIMLHDFAFEYFPDSYSREELKRQKKSVEKAIKKAKIVLLTSESNRNDLYKFYPDVKAKTEIVPLAFDKETFTVSGSKDILKIGKYILSVGRLEYRKNTINLVKAFDIFKDKSKSDLKLVLTGKPGYGYEQIIETVDSSKFKKDIILPGYIKSEELPYLYKNAEMLVYPSLYEGFGLPILEAFATGTPVITSNVSTIKEVAGEGAILVDPQDIEEISESMDNLINNISLRRKLVEKGEQIIKNYSWKETAIKLRETISRL